MNASSDDIKIIDCHTHLYPSELKDHLVEWGRDRKEYYWMHLMKEEEGRQSIQDWPTVKEFLNAMDEASIEKAILLGWYWERQETCVWHNDWMFNCMKEYPSRFLAFAAVQPRDGYKSVIEDLKQRRDQGFVGVGEIFHKVQQFDMRDEEWERILRWIESVNWPVNLHVTDPVGKEYKGRVMGELADYVGLAKKHPNLKIILAHLGGLLGFYEANTHVKSILKNVYYDLSALPRLYDLKIIQTLIEVVGAKKVIFGSDYPLKLYPNLKKAEFKKFVEDICFNLSGREAVLKEVMSGNIKNILGL